MIMAADVLPPNRPADCYRAVIIEGPSKPSAKSWMACGAWWCPLSAVVYSAVLHYAAADVLGGMGELLCAAMAIGCATRRTPGQDRSARAM